MAHRAPPTHELSGLATSLAHRTFLASEHAVHADYTRIVHIITGIGLCIFRKICEEISILIIKTEYFIMKRLLRTNPGKLIHEANY